MRIAQNRKLEKILELALARLAPLGLTMLAQGRVAPCATFEEATKVYGPLIDIILDERVQRISQIIRELETGGVGLTRREHIEILAKKYKKSRAQVSRYMQIYREGGPFRFLHRKKRRI
jgi:hypothetical protein